VDVIIGSSSSTNLRQVLLTAAGDEVQAVYMRDYENNPNSLIISTLPGYLSCKRIFFLKWEPDQDDEILRQSIVDLISNVIQNVRSHNYTSIAFPAIGCGGHACSVDIVVKTMIREMKQQIEKRKLPWTVKFIIQPDQQNVYDEFCKQLLLSDHLPDGYQISLTRQRSEDEQLRFIVSKNTDEYNSVINKFHEAMKGQYTEIIKLERIQNERWRMQYIAHWKDFKKRLNEDTEKRLYHGCPESAANSIIEDCFNRSFAGVNGISLFFYPISM
jgi:O-acetyl-ADP-ribose deacetylase (regulator of RNase III)